MTTENTERLFDEIEHYAYDDLVASDLNGLSTEDIADLGADLVREASKNWISNNLNDELVSAFRTENRAEANLMIEQFKAHQNTTHWNDHAIASHVLGEIAYGQFTKERGVDVELVKDYALGEREVTRPPSI